MKLNAFRRATRPALNFPAELLQNIVTSFQQAGATINGVESSEFRIRQQVLRARQGGLGSGGWLNSPAAANRTAEFGQCTGKSAANLRQVGASGADVCIPEVGRGLRVQVRHGGLLGCGGGVSARSSLTSIALHDERVKPVRRM